MNNIEPEFDKQCIKSPQKNPQNHFEIFHQNIASILSKQEILEITLLELQNKNINPDALCFTESFLKQNYNKYVNIKGYILATSYNREKCRGGSCILLKESLYYTELMFLKHHAVNNVFECCGVEICSSKIIIICIYRTPSSNPNIFLDKLELMLHELFKKFRSKVKVIIAGDININTLQDGKVTDRFRNIALTNNLNIHINQPTRKTSCLDHILSNINDASALVLPLYLSDHDTAQLLKFPVDYIARRRRSYFIYKRDYSDEYIHKFKDCLANLPWSDIYAENDFNHAFDKFYELLQLLYKLCFPKIRIKINNTTTKKQRWISKGLKISCKTKRLLRYKYYTTKLSSFKQKYYLYSKVLQKCIYRSKKNMNVKYIVNSKNKCRATWSVINSETTSTAPVRDGIDCIKVNNILIQDPTEIATAFNNHYITSVSDVHNIQNQVLIHYNLVNTIFLMPLSELEVKKEVMSLNNSKSVGHDEISTHIIKNCIDEILPVLTYLINYSFEQGKFPEALKLSIVRPLFKKGDKDDINNYRPIALLPILSKVFEKCMLSRLLKFCDKFNIIKDQQYGFQKGKSTTLAVFTLIKAVLTNINKKRLTTGLFLDLSKAFDYVSHDLLLRKLDSLGIRGHALQWLSSFLVGRSQCVEITNINKSNEMMSHYSGYSCVRAGVPQGSVLGPILFLLYLNDITEVTNHQCILFADDISLIVTSNKHNLNSINDHESDINDTVTTLIEWLEKNKLKINLNKSHYIQFNQSNKSINSFDMNIHYNNTSINKVYEINFLGINIDRDLNWISHLNKVASRVNQFVYALKRVKVMTDIKTAVVAYHAYVESVLRYGLILWGNGNSAMLNRAFISQKKCLRAICGIPPYESCKPLFSKLGLLPLPCLYILEVSLFVQKHSNLFKRACNVSNRVQRDPFRLVFEEVPKSAKYDKNCLTLCVRIYNKIPNEFKLLNIGLFKKRLHEWLLKNCFYHVNELLNKRNY